MLRILVRNQAGDLFAVTVVKDASEAFRILALWCLAEPPRIEVRAA